MQSNLNRPNFKHLNASFHKMARVFLCVGVLAMAGCATGTKTASDSNANLFADDYYLAQNKNDPLGAWINNNDDHPLNYPNGKMSSNQKTMASTALQFLGVKYRYGGNGPSEGFDCSGLVAYAAEKSLGLKLPRTASAQAKHGVVIKKDELQRGDLVFFNTLGRSFSHVGIYLGDNKFVHSPRSGAKIRVESMDVAYWKNRYNGARRMEQSTLTASR